MTAVSVAAVTERPFFVMAAPASTGTNARPRGFLVGAGDSGSHFPRGAAVPPTVDQRDVSPPVRSGAEHEVTS